MSSLPSFATPDASDADNPNHHLWNNHGTWLLHCTIHPTPFTKERVRRSLGTRDIVTARRRRDVYLRWLHSEGLLPPARTHAQIALHHSLSTPLTSDAAKTAEAKRPKNIWAEIADKAFAEKISGSTTCDRNL